MADFGSALLPPHYFLPSQMPIGLAAWKDRRKPEHMLYSMKEISSCGVLASKTRFFVRAQNLSIKLIWVQPLLRELCVQQIQTPVLWRDNIGATHLSSNTVFHAQTKHIEVDLHFIREQLIRRNFRFGSSPSKIKLQTSSPSLYLYLCLNIVHTILTL
jgi:hypothetical protein